MINTAMQWTCVHSKTRVVLKQKQNKPYRGMGRILSSLFMAHTKPHWMYLGCNEVHTVHPHQD